MAPTFASFFFRDRRVRSWLRACRIHHYRTVRNREVLQHDPRKPLAGRQGDSRTSETSQASLFPTYGQAGSPARMSQWREWGRELGLKGRALDSFLSLLDYLHSTVPEFSSSRTFQASSLRTVDATSESLFKRWPNSGMAWDGVCLTAGTSEFPSHVKESILLDAIETGEVPQRYFLSPNAAKGMLRRADRMGRPLFPPFKTSFGDPCPRAGSSRNRLLPVRVFGPPYGHRLESDVRHVSRLGECGGCCLLNASASKAFPTTGLLRPENNGWGDADSVDSLRYYALGNAVSVVVAEWLAARINGYLADSVGGRANGVTPA